MLTSDMIRKFRNFSNANCTLAEGFTKLYKNEAANREINFEIPDYFGSGNCNKIILNKDLEIYYYKVKFKRNIKMYGKSKGKAFFLTLCTGENMEWTELNSKAEIQMNTGQGILYQPNDVIEFCEYKPNHEYKGLFIIIKPDKFIELISSYSLNEDIFSKHYTDFKINQFTIPTESKIVIEQMLRCPYDNNIKNMYLQGKVIELFSICLNAITQKRMNNVSNIKLSKTEIQSLYKAKEILDNSISSPITLNKLSKLVFLNEFKLKNGFKKMFGKPVYTYLLDKRMEIARLFLEISHIRVNEVAHMVGYSNISSFSKAFRKKYGFNPSDCLYNVKEI